MANAITVSAPSRLHFGLLRFEQRAGLSYGGMGMMIDRPRVEVSLAEADAWSAIGPASARALAFAQQALASLGENQRPPALSIAVSSGIPRHRGLGSGTQLAFAIAAGVRAMAGLDPGAPEDLASMVGRGQRSAVGSHGFLRGGLIWERGREPGQLLAPLARRVAVPQQWRVVLMTPPRQKGLSGQPELNAFRTLPPVPAAVTDRLEALAEAEIIPALERADVESFGEAVYQYGRLAGSCFAAVQGGAFATAQTAACVAAVRELGVHGVGQSSWGPTVFAITPDAEQAQQLIDRMAADPAWATHEYQLASADNRGAIIDAPSRSSVPARRNSGDASPPYVRH